MANIYFLFISILMTLGWYTDLLPKLMSAFTTLFPLAVILASTLLKEGLEDKKRHEADAETNMRDPDGIDVSNLTAEKLHKILHPNTPHRRIFNWVARLGARRRASGHRAPFLSTSTPLPLPRRTRFN